MNQGNGCSNILFSESFIADQNLQSKDQSDYKPSWTEEASPLENPQKFHWQSSQLLGYKVKAIHFCEL